jgi:hypothetical protein
MIKRKINKQHGFNSAVDDSELSEIIKEDKDLMGISRKGLEGIYGNLVRNVEELTKRQTELDSQINFLNKKNEDYILKNKSVTDEVANKR